MASTTEDNQIKLYVTLIDQLTKYNAIIWQIPTALFAANILVLDKLISNPYFILAAFIFNSSLIFAFYKMIVQQRRIIDSTQKAENTLRVEYSDFIPVFKKSKFGAPKLFVWVLSSLNMCLFGYFVWILTTI